MACPFANQGPVLHSYKTKSGSGKIFAEPPEQDNFVKSFWQLMDLEEEQGNNSWQLQV